MYRRALPLPDAVADGLPGTEPAKDLNLDDIGSQLPKVLFDGEKHPVRMANVLGINDAAKTQKLGQVFLHLAAQMEDTKVQDNEEQMTECLDQMSTAVDDFLDIVLNLWDPEVRKKLDDDPQASEKKMAIMSFFGEQAVLQRSSLQNNMNRALRRSQHGTVSATKTS